MMRSGNPALKPNTFLDLGTGGVVSRDGGAMTLNGTINKTGILLLLTVITAAFAWNSVNFVPGLDGRMVAQGVMPFVLVGGLGGFILAMVTVFKQSWAPVTAPMYALLEGLFLGAISAMYASKFQGIVPMAVMCTFGTLGALLLAYRSGLIKVTENFKMGVVAATGGIALVYLATIVLGLFNIQVPYIHGSGVIGIGFSLFVVAIAAMNLVLDFDLIEQGVETGAPKYMEWYGGFALLVTLVWLYLEFLRLISKIQQR